MAVLREQFDLAEELLANGRSDKYYKNSDGENVFDIAKRLNIKSVQKFLINLQKKTTNPLPTKNTPDFNLEQ